MGFDSIVEAAGSPATLELAVELAARAGKILVFGVAPMNAVARLRPYDLFVRELTLIGTVINPYTHERAVNLLPRLGLEALSIAAFPLDRYKEAFEAQTAGAAMKIELLPQESV